MSLVCRGCEVEVEVEVEVWVGGWMDGWMGERLVMLVLCLFCGGLFIEVGVGAGRSE